MPNFDNPYRTRQINAAVRPGKNQLSGADTLNTISQVFQFTVPTGAVQNDTYTLCELPAGAYILPHSRLDNAALGASTTVSVGTSASATAYLAATATSSTGSQTLANGIRTRIALTAPTSVILTFGGANPTAGAELAVHLFYTLPTS